MHTNHIEVPCAQCTPCKAIVLVTFLVALWTLYHPIILYARILKCFLAIKSKKISKMICLFFMTTSWGDHDESKVLNFTREWAQTTYLPKWLASLFCWQWTFTHRRHFLMDMRHWQLIRSKLGFYFSSGIMLDMDVFFFCALPIDQSKIKHTKKLKEIPFRHDLENLLGKR